MSSRRSADPDEQGSQPLTHVPSPAARRERPAGGAHGPGQNPPDTPWSPAGAAADRDIAGEASNSACEADFLDLAKDLAKDLEKTGSLPLTLTGGITRRATAERVRDSGVAAVGTGTALAVTPACPTAGGSTARPS